MFRGRLLPVLILSTVAACGDIQQEPVEVASALNSSAIALEPLSSACPASRSDELCDRLRAGDYARAGQLVAARTAAEARAQVLRDPAVRWWVRERAVALLAWNASPGASDPLLAQYFPAYPAGAFPIAGAGLAPDLTQESCSRPTEALVIFVGVLRSTNHEEFDRQTAALRNTFPCLRTARVEYDSFAPPTLNAAKARALIAQIDAELGPVPLHFLGYSQGVTNALHTLVDYPEVAPRVRTFVSLNSAARGSETADALLAGLALANRVGATCDDLPVFARRACHLVDRQQLTPIADFLKAGLANLGFDFGDIDDGLTVGEFLRRREAGLRSLGTAETAQFWREHGAQLPQSTLYLSFRSFVGDSSTNLPGSNAWSWVLLSAIDRHASENDMQVRLVQQPLGGPLAGLEVVGPAAEGNHWQWELTSNDIGENLQPSEMSERMPHEALLLAYYQTLHEAGLLLPVH
jgi:hypothetical protein